jgi:endonuclease YncB( thermonuclease family)
MLGKPPQRPGPLLLLVLIVVLLAAVGVAAYSKFSNSEPPQSTQIPSPALRAQTPPAISKTTKGQASVIDGDTIEIHGARIRLFGIDAPESGQLCPAQGKTYPCGKQAALVLADKIKGHVVECRPKNQDQYGRPVAVCFAAGEDINGWMVAQGWALAYRQYSMDYVNQEHDAANSKLGIWKYEFEKPWDWRRKHPEQRPTSENNSSKSQRSSGLQSVVYYPPGDLSGKRYQTMTECEQARQRAGNVGVCVMK